MTLLSFSTSRTTAASLTLLSFSTSRTTAASRSRRSCRTSRTSRAGRSRRSRRASLTLFALLSFSPCRPCRSRRSRRSRRASLTLLSFRPCQANFALLSFSPCRPCRPCRASRPRRSRRSRRANFALLSFSPCQANFALLPFSPSRACRANFALLSFSPSRALQSSVCNCLFFPRRRRHVIHGNKVGSYRVCSGGKGRKRRPNISRIGNIGACFNSIEFGSVCGNVSTIYRSGDSDITTNCCGSKSRSAVGSYGLTNGKLRPRQSHACASSINGGIRHKSKYNVCCTKSNNTNGCHYI